MQYFPPALETLVEQFAKLPGVGVKSAQRLAFYVLSMSEEAATASSLPNQATALFSSGFAARGPASSASMR